MEGSQRDHGGRPGPDGRPAVEEPVAKAGRLFASLTEQAARRLRPRPEPVLAPVLPEGADAEPGPAEPGLADRRPAEPGGAEPGPTLAGATAPGAPAAGHAPPAPAESAARVPDVGEVLEMVRAALAATNERLAALERVLLTDEPKGTEPADQALEQLGRSLQRSASSPSGLGDDLRSTEDVQAASGWLPVLGLLPEVERWKGRSSSLVKEETREERLAAEAYRALRTSVLFLGVDRQMRTIQVTSPLPGEGKSTVTANLAVALARTGSRVIALSCDLRRPHLHELFGLPNDKGFTSVLQRQAPLQNVIQQVPGVPGLKLVSSGPAPPDPSELLLSERTGEIIESLQTSCDVLLIDCPPVLPVSDAVALSQQVQATIVVVGAGRASRRDLHRTVDVLRLVDAPVLGTVVNDISRDDTGFGLDGSRYDYGSR